ncbi:MAG: AlpA family phage regulatory protein [Alcaligenaceae bacterium]|nr:MAG: AlpA family phage regulatory protein [Alcaligenaceae bacterium]
MRHRVKLICPPTQPSTATRRRPNFDDLPASALVSVRVLAETLGISRATVWRRIAYAPDAFPKPMRQSVRCTRFNVGDIRSYIASLTPRQER